MTNKEKIKILRESKKQIEYSLKQIEETIYLRKCNIESLERSIKLLEEKEEEFQSRNQPASQTGV